MITRLLSASRLLLVAPHRHLSRWKNSVSIATWQSAPSSNILSNHSSPFQRSQVYRFSQEKENFDSIFQDSESDFCNLIRSRKLKVDKTMFIKEVLSHGNRCTFLTRPRGWGKSLNLSMIKYFFGIPIDSRGNITKGKYRSLFKGDPKMGLLPLLISKESSIMKQQGQYPVISLSIPSEQHTHLSFKFALAKEMMRAYGDNSYMLDPSEQQEEEDLMSREMKQFKYIYQTLKRIVNGTIKEADNFQISDVLEVLINALHNYHRKKVIVLIDELDGQANFMLNLINKAKNEEQKREITAEFEKATRQMRKLLRRGLKESSCLKFSLLTGVYNTPLKTFGSGFNNVRKQGIDSRQFTSSLGYNKQEVEELVDACLPRLKGNKSQLMKNIKDWYGGYDAVSKGMKKIYNPWSVNFYLNQCVRSNKILPPQSYWVTTRTDELIKEAFRSAFTNQDLLSKMLALVPNNYPFTMQKVDLQIEQGQFNITELDPRYRTQKGLAYMLYHGGYLTGQISKNTETSKTILTARIPNKEIKKIYQEIFLEIWNKRHQGLAKLDLCSYENFKATVTGYLKKYSSDFRYQARLANHVVLLVNSNKSVKYEILLEATARIGRLDHFFIPLRQKLVYVSEEPKVVKGSAAKGEDPKTTMILHLYKYISYPKKGQDILYKALKDAYHEVNSTWSIKYISRLKEQFEKRDYLQSVVIRQVVFMVDSQESTKQKQTQTELYFREQVHDKDQINYMLEREEQRKNARNAST